MPVDDIGSERLRLLDTHVFTSAHAEDVTIRLRARPEPAASLGDRLGTTRCALW